MKPEVTYAFTWISPFRFFLHGTSQLETTEYLERATECYWEGRRDRTEGSDKLPALSLADSRAKRPQDRQVALAKDLNSSEPGQDDGRGNLGLHC